MMVYHVPQMLERFQNLKQFTGQGKMNRCKILILVSVKNENFSYTLLYFLGVEKKNDDMRKAFHRSINRWDACKSLIVIDKRLEILHSQKRCKRKYERKNSSFWEEGKALVVKNYPRVSVPKKLVYPTCDETEQTNTENQSPKENDQGNDSTYTKDQLQRMTVAQLRHILVAMSDEPVNKRARKPILIETILDITKP